MQGHRCLHDRFGEKKWSTFQKARWRSAPKSSRPTFFNVSYLAPKTFYSPQRSEKCTVLFLSFLRLKMKNLSPIRQSCDTIRLKPSIRGIAFLTHKSNFEQANLGDLGFCSPYSPLCFGYGVYSEMIMNLRMIKTMPIILFNNMRRPYSHRNC